MVYEPITFSLLEAIKEEFKRIQIALNEFELEKSCSAFVFFPSLGKGVTEIFSQYSAVWSFFRYQFLNSDKQEGFVLEEYSHQGAEEATSELAFLFETVKANRFSQHWLKRSCLTREELLELIEISLNLKEIVTSP